MSPHDDAPTWPSDFAERYRAAGWWRGETFGSMLRERAEAHPDRIAVVDPAAEIRWSYAELDRRADRLAAGLLARNITKGDRVVVQLPNVAEFFEVVFALFRIGALPVFALPAHRETEISYFCEFTEAVAYVVAAEHGGYDYRELAARTRAGAPELRHVFVARGEPGEFEALADVAEEPVGHGAPRPDDLAFLQLSGGSTGVPKLIPRTHDDYIYSLRGSNEICGVDENSVYLCALPAAHNFPLSSPGSLGTFYAAWAAWCCARSPPRGGLPADRTGAGHPHRTGPPAGPAVDPGGHGHRTRPQQPGRPVGGWRQVQRGGGTAGQPALGCTLQQVFGMAEGLVNYTRLDDPVEVIVTTQGRPISPDDEILVVDDEDQEVAPGETGHLLTRGPYTIRGYWRAPEHNARSFTEDGFYRTGDVVRVAPSGHIVVEGRAKDQINRGGEKIAAEEVENHILAHPFVHDANVVAEPDPYLGERTCAYVILRPGAGPLKPVDIKRFVRERDLAAYKVPDRVEFVDTFPRTGVGKISKKALRTAAARGTSASTPA